MIRINNTIILVGDEKPYQGECTVDVVNRADNIISIFVDEETGRDNFRVIKIKNTAKTLSINSLMRRK